MKTEFNMNEMENAFEIGRCIQFFGVEYEDSKDAFFDALTWAVEFEEKHADTEDYYCDIFAFVEKKLKEIGLI